MKGHWEIYLSRERASGELPWAACKAGEPPVNAEYASTIVIKVQSYSGLATHGDRPRFVIHCYGFLRRVGSVIYIEDPTKHDKNLSHDVVV